MAKTPAQALHEALARKDSVDSREAIESVATAYPKQWEHDPIGALQRSAADERLSEHVINVPAYVSLILRTPIAHYGHVCHWIQCEETRLDGCRCCAQHELVIRANTNEPTKASPEETGDDR